MASFGDVIGAIISQIGKGRSQADMATLEVAQIYKDHPLLSTFPVPRVSLDEVVIDLKMAITAVPVPKVFTSKAKTDLLSQLGKVVGDLVITESSVDKLSQKFPKFPEIWKSTHNQLMQRLSDLLPIEMEVEPKSIAYGMASTIGGHLTSTVLKLDARAVNKVPRDFLEKESPLIETKLASQIQETISKLLEIQSADKNRLDVLVTASDLQSIPPDKITSVKLTLREADQTWTQIETERGEVKDKLIPG